MTSFHCRSLARSLGVDDVLAAHRANACARFSGGAAIGVAGVTVGELVIFLGLTVVQFSPSLIRASILLMVVVLLIALNWVCMWSDVIWDAMQTLLFSRHPGQIIPRTRSGVVRAQFIWLLVAAPFAVFARLLWAL